MPSAKVEGILEDLSFQTLMSIGNKPRYNVEASYNSLDFKGIREFDDFLNQHGRYTVAGKHIKLTLMLEVEDDMPKV